MLSKYSPLNFTFKIASRCNLNCSYCYVFNKADQSWQNKPKIMPEAVFFKTIERIREYSLISKQERVNIIFHGGEPCLVGSSLLDKWCSYAVDQLSDVLKVRFTIQTNGTLIDPDWIQLFKKHKINVGISLDGPKEIHDHYRIDFAGNGSYDKIMQSINLFKQADISISILSVIPLGQDPLMFHRHLEQIGVDTIDYILPDFSHDSIGLVRETFGAHPCSDFLIPLFDYWWEETDMQIQIEPFIAIATSILGGRGHVDFIGNLPFGFLFVESDGTLESLDVLKVCKDGLSSTGLNVFNNGFDEIIGGNSIHSQSIFTGVPLPDACNGCREMNTCSGGYLPHRYSSKNMFNNPSVWCNDLLKLFTHIRKALHVSLDETGKRLKLVEETKLALVNN